MKYILSFLVTLFIVPTSLVSQKQDNTAIEIVLNNNPVSEVSRSELKSYFKTLDTATMSNLTFGSLTYATDPNDFPRPKSKGTQKWYRSTWFLISVGVVATTTTYLIIDAKKDLPQSPLPFPPGLPD